jgi:hypothetical protein
MFGDAPAFLIFNRGAGRKTRTKHTLSYACFTTIIFMLWIGISKNSIWAIFSFKNIGAIDRARLTRLL